MVAGIRSIEVLRGWPCIPQPCLEAPVDMAPLQTPHKSLSQNDACAVPTALLLAPVLMQTTLARRR